MSGIIRPDLEVRESRLSDVDFKLRLIELIAVPYEQEAEVLFRGEVWRESFSRKAFAGIETRKGQVRVNREHVRGDTVGKVAEFDPDHPDGLVARIRVAKTLRGDETLVLAEEEMLSASVGFGVRNSDQELDKRNRLRKVNRAFLDHLSMVESPAYEGAKVLTVRQGPDAQPGEQRPLVDTPGLDEFLNDPLLRYAAQRSQRD